MRLPLAPADPRRLREKRAADDESIRARIWYGDPVVAGGVGFRAQPLFRLEVVEPAACVSPDRTPRDTLGAMGVGGLRRQGAKVRNHIARAHVVSSRRRS
jgi:hypothetical protein